MMVYKDQKVMKTTPDMYFKGEPPIEITGGTASIADDYTKKKNVFRLK